MLKIEVGKRGKYYTLNSKIVEPKDFMGIGGFKWCNHIFAWVRGGAHGEGGGVHLTRAKQYIEDEVIGNGCMRMRAAVENMMQLSKEEQEKWYDEFRSGFDSLQDA